MDLGLQEVLNANQRSCLAPGRPTDFAVIAWRWPMLQLNAHSFGWCCFYGCCWSWGNLLHCLFPQKERSPASWGLGWFNCFIHFHFRLFNRFSCLHWIQFGCLSSPHLPSSPLQFCTDLWLGMIQSSSCSLTSLVCCHSWVFRRHDQWSIFAGVVTCCHLWCRLVFVSSWLKRGCQTSSPSYSLV